MPGYAIHLAIAEEYLIKHKDRIEDYDSFIEGVKFPDSVQDKSLTHYGKGSSNSNLVKFLEENEIDTSFNRGYFLHLLTDYLFYNSYINSFSKEIYNDYDLMNEKIIKKYNVKITNDIEKYLNFINEGEYKVFDFEYACRIIDEISSLDIDQIEKEIHENPNKWLKFRSK